MMDTFLLVLHSLHLTLGIIGDYDSSGREYQPGMGMSNSETGVGRAHKPA